MPYGTVSPQDTCVSGPVVLAVLIVFTSLLVLLIQLTTTAKSLSDAYKKLKSKEEQQASFLNASRSLISLKDANLKYIFVNQAFEKRVKLSSEDILGKDSHAVFPEGLIQRTSDLDLSVLENRQLIMDVIPWKNQIFRITKFPVVMDDGTTGIGTYITEITEKYQSRKKQEREFLGSQLLVKVLRKKFKDTQEHLDYALHLLLDLSESEFGYIYLYDEKTQQFVNNSWTEGVMEECSVPGTPRVYQLENTGIWGEVVRQRKPIIVNNFQDHHPLKKGYPLGHVNLKNFMSVPVIVEDEIVAVIGLANKPGNYEPADTYEMTTLMTGVWNAVQRKKTREALTRERNKHYQTLLSIADGVIVIDKDEKVEFLNLAASKLTGWTQLNAINKHYKEVIFLSREDKSTLLEDPVEQAFATGQIQKPEEKIILTSKDGLSYYVEISAAPIPDETSSKSGVVFVFQDITEREKQSEKIEHILFHDSLTGLYNRRFFEEALKRFDVPENLPISILMGDVDSLKLTNDIFGHASGDLLLKTVAGALKDVCRTGDVLARWGGDEFALLLPKTAPDDAEKIIQRIDEHVPKHRVRAIKCSISMGRDTKLHSSQDIHETLNNAVMDMFSTKTLTRLHVQNQDMDAIVNELFEKSEETKRHALFVQEYGPKLGVALGLEDSDLKRLAQAGWLHDIGKITLDPDILKREPSELLTPAEREQLKRHPAVGYRLLNHFDQTVELADTVLAYQECWNGSGYPKGLKGRDIPFLARVLSVVCNYGQILQTQRKKFGKINVDEALQEMKQKAGNELDPRIVRTFINLVHREREKESLHDKKS